MCKITIITDNLASGEGFLAEHGFSALVQTNGKNILFDTGAGKTAQNNLSRMGLGVKFDALVLSHGHYDHTGGLFENGCAVDAEVLYGADTIFQKHLRQNADNTYTNIGIPYDKSDIESSYNIKLNKECTEIMPNVFLSGKVERARPFDADKRLYSEKNGEIVKDKFDDEQFLIIRTDKGLNILTGCSHTGVINIVLHTEKLFPDEKLNAIIGGFHLFRSDDEDVLSTAEFLAKRNFNHIYTGHCTGIEQTFMLKEKLSGVSLLRTGTVIEI